MGNDSIIAFKTREQLRKYVGIFSPQFRNSRWKMEFIGQMLFYAIADGLRWLFVRHGRWRGWSCPSEECGDLQMEFEVLSG